MTSTEDEGEKLEELARALYEGKRMPHDIPWERLAVAMRRQWVERARVELEKDEQGS
jgi:hypothetical protein